MDDDTGTLCDHCREQGAIEADRGHQVLVQLFRPLLIIERRKPTARRTRPTKHIDEDVDAPELLEYRLGSGTSAVNG